MDCTKKKYSIVNEFDDGMSAHCKDCKLNEVSR